MSNSLCKSVVSMVLFCLPLLCQAEFMPKLKGTFLLEHEGFLVWYAKEQEWDKELGFELELNIVNSSGLDLLNELREDSQAWHISSVGMTPFLLGNQGLELQAIALANDESAATEILVRPDSPILHHRGENQAFPHLYGSPETIRGKTFLLRDLTSPLHTLISYLQAFNLNLADIKLENVRTQDLLNSMNAGQGDGMILWSPNSYDAKNQGYVTVGNAKMLGIFVPMLIVCERSFAEQNSEIISKFLTMYLHAVEQQRHKLPELIPAYQNFMQLYAQKPYNELFCQYDLEKHPIFAREEQLELFNSQPDGLSPLTVQLQKTQDEYLKFLPADKVALAKAELKQLPEVTAKYLQQAPLWPSQKKEQK